MCDTYNGWTNRETWALNLWLTNDQGLYELASDRVREAENAARADSHAACKIHAGEAIKDLWDELTDPDEELMSAEQILTMVRDVGSEYRINWDELGAFWLSHDTEADACVRT